MRALVTGGCGFIGSHIVKALLADGWEVTNLDALTYAANPANLADVAANPAYTFVHGTICDPGVVGALVGNADAVLNFAAETHVDRSLLRAVDFVRTDVEGTVTLLDALRANPQTHFIHMSTDEVFGPTLAPYESAEDDPFAPSSPYSASKAAAELEVNAYVRSYGLSAHIVRACNVYGPSQHPEKFIPLFITRALAGEPLPLYGDGMQEREWLYIDDLVAAIRHIMGRLAPGLHAFHAGSGERVPNIRVAQAICRLTGRPEELIRPVADRPGHDRRYALSSARMHSMGWRPTVTFEGGLARTVRWFRENQAAWRQAASASSFEDFFAQQYGSRLAGG